jgi:hypothetical protein
MVSPPNGNIVHAAFLHGLRLIQIAPTKTTGVFMAAFNATQFGLR